MNEEHCGIIKISIKKNLMFDICNIELIDLSKCNFTLKNINNIRYFIIKLSDDCDLRLKINKIKISDITKTFNCICDNTKIYIRMYDTCGYNEIKKIFYSKNNDGDIGS